MSAHSEVSLILEAMNGGDRSGTARLWELVYPEIRKLAKQQFKGERSDHTLQPTALVNEAFLRLADQDRVRWRGRAHFLSVAAGIMRRILVDQARQRMTDKRGGRV